MSCGIGHRRGSDLVLLWSVAQASSCSSNSTPCLVTSIHHRYSPKKKPLCENGILGPRAPLLSSTSGYRHLQPPSPRDGSSPVPLIPMGPLHNHYQNGKQQDSGTNNPHNDHQLITAQDLRSEVDWGHRRLGEERRGATSELQYSRKELRAHQFFSK